MGSESELPEHVRPAGGGGTLLARIEGHDALVFCSNDYLGLRGDVRVVAGGVAAAERYGAGSGSSRLIAGSLPIHRALEEAIADWMGTEAALVFPSGYQANIALLGALVERGDLLVSDSLNHASIIDGARLAHGRRFVVTHGDPSALRRGLAKPGKTRFAVLEGLYSMDGDRGAVADWLDATRAAGAHLLVDEAHAIGVFGPEGRGVAAEQGLGDACLARVGTFGKSFGSHGAFVACSSVLRDLIVNRGRTYIFTTGLPPFSAGAALAALQILRSAEGDERRARLKRSSRRLRAALNHARLDVLGDEDSPIVPVVLGSEEAALRCSEELLRKRVFATAIRPPTVAPGTCRVRFTLSSEHSDEMVDAVVAAIAG